MKKLIHILLFVALPSFVHASEIRESGTIGDFIRNDDGTVKLFAWGIGEEAAQVQCARRGSRIPTARQYAREAEKYGGKILRLSEYDRYKSSLTARDQLGNILDDFNFYPVFSKALELAPYYFPDVYTHGHNPYENDAFYYSTRNYKAPTGAKGTLNGDIANYWTWTVSRTHGGYLRAFNGKTGEIDDGSYLSMNYMAALRCAKIDDK